MAGRLLSATARAAVQALSCFENPASAGFFMGAPILVKPPRGPPPAAPSPVDAMPIYLRQTADGVVLDMLVVPHGHRTEWFGVHDGASRLGLAALPSDGRANRALLSWLAERFHLARKELSLLRGASSRRTQMLVRRPFDEVHRAFDDGPSPG